MSSCSRSRYQLSGSNRSSAARVQGVQGRLQRGLEGMIRWLRPMTAANSSSDQARFTLPGEQHQQPGQGRRAISVPLTAVKSGAGRPRPGTQVGRSGHDGLFRSDSQADSASFEPDPHRVGHSWDAAHRRSSLRASPQVTDQALARAVEICKPSASTIGPLPVRSAGREGIISPAWLRGRPRRGDPETAA